jgi:hypothetical protein
MLNGIFAELLQDFLGKKVYSKCNGKAYGGVKSSACAVG